MGTHPIFESDFDCLTESEMGRKLNRKRLLAILDNKSVSKSVIDEVKPVNEPVAEPQSKKVKKPEEKFDDEELDFQKAHKDIIEEFGSDPELSGSESEDEENNEKLQDFQDFDSFEDFSDDEIKDDTMEVIEDVKTVTEEKLTKWVAELESDSYRALLPLSQALYASIVSVDDREETKKKNEKINEMS